MNVRVVAPLLAAVLGIAGGVATALIVPEKDSAREPASAPPTVDPLGLDIPLVNQEDCTGKSLLIIGWGDQRSALSPAVANTDHEGLRYLRTADSCATIFGPEDQAQPYYAVYRGPFDTRSEPCRLRMSGEEPGTIITVLRAGNLQLVKCPCELPTSMAPHLSLGMEADAVDRVWTRALQSMFNDSDPDGFPASAVTGVYDQRTADRVTLIQDHAPAHLTTRGEVDEETWRIITERMCRNYDY